MTELALDNKNSLHKPLALRLNGFSGFVIFIISIAASQFFQDINKAAAFFFLFSAIIALFLILLLGSNRDYCVFLFLNCLVRLKIPFLNEREFGLILPIVFLLIAGLKMLFIPGAFRIKKTYLRITLFIFLGYFVFVFVTFFAHNLQLPGGGVNSGFLGRFNLLNTFFVFLFFLIVYRTDMFDYLIDKFYKFYLTVLFISLFLIAFNIERIPIFNTFNWSLIIESATSKKMIIAGIAAMMIFIYALCFKKNWVFLISLSALGVLMSGVRSSFLAFIIIAFCYWAAKKRVLGKSILISAIPIWLFILFSLSPLVLYVPGSLQRLFIIFPSQYYTGHMRELRNSSAASSSDFRFEMWSKAITEMPDHLWTGNGLGVPKAAYDFGEEGLAAFQRIPQEILIKDFMNVGGLHNTFISIAYVMGILAFVFFLLGFVGLISSTYLRSFVSNSERKNQMLFFTMVLLYYFVKALISDIYFELDFFAFLTIGFKTVFENPHRMPFSTKNI